MPTAKVTKNVSAATGGGNVLCSTLISIKTKAWLYFFRPSFLCVPIRGRKINFRAELYGICIYRYTPNYRASTVFSTFGRIEIKQDCKGASFGFCILFHIDNNLE